MDDDVEEALEVSDDEPLEEPLGLVDSELLGDDDDEGVGEGTVVIVDEPPVVLLAEPDEEAKAVRSCRRRWRLRWPMPSRRH